MRAEPVTLTDFDQETLGVPKKGRSHCFSVPVVHDVIVFAY